MKLLAALKAYESAILKAHSAALAAGFAVLLSSIKDGHLTPGDIELIATAVIGAWSVVYVAPNKDAS